MKNKCKSSNKLPFYTDLDKEENIDDKGESESITVSSEEFSSLFPEDEYRRNMTYADVALEFIKPKFSDYDWNTTSLRQKKQLARKLLKLGCLTQENLKNISIKKRGPILCVKV